MQNDKGDESRKRLSSERQRISILRKAFDVYDVDGSGAIDYNEFRRLLDDLGWPSHEEFLRRAVRVLDQDMSGEIEFSEFQKWTKFAYASRILYRQEMYGSGPRYFSDDTKTLRPLVQKPGSLVKKSESGRRGLIIRRASLRTVLEKPEEPNTAVSNTQGDSESSDESSDEDMGAESGGSSRRGRGSHSRKERGENGGLIPDGDGTSKSESGKEGLQPTRGSVSMVAFRGQPVSEERGKAEILGADGHKGDVDEQTYDEQTYDDRINDIETTDGAFEGPVQEMSAMGLKLSSRGRKSLALVSRSKSVGILGERQKVQLDQTTLEEEEPCEFGPRSDSKMTIRMRWACGQFGSVTVDARDPITLVNEEGNSEDERESNDREKSTADDQRQLGTVDKLVENNKLSESRRQTYRDRPRAPAPGDYSLWNDVGVDLRRIRSD